MLQMEIYSDLFLKAINETYKENLQLLKNFVLVKFTRDTVVQPMESEWFGFYKENNLKETYTLRESLLYQEVIKGPYSWSPVRFIH